MIIRSECGGCNAGREQTIKVSGPLSSNNGEVALRWALDGCGILLRSMWQVASLLADGKLVHVLPGCLEPANVWAGVSSTAGALGEAARGRGVFGAVVSAPGARWRAPGAHSKKAKGL